MKYKWSDSELKILISLYEKELSKKDISIEMCLDYGTVKRKLNKLFGTSYKRGNKKVFDKNCDYCKIHYITTRSNSRFCKRSCCAFFNIENNIISKKYNADKIRNIINWKEFQLDHNNGMNPNKLMIKYKLSISHLRIAIREGLFHHNKKIIEFKDKIINLGHSWKRKDRFISKPCEHLKNILIDHNVYFIEEYIISDDRKFAIDIAIPKKKICIEINGNQHYNKDGTLKIYYQDRHDYIKNLGWSVWEIPFNYVYKNDFVEKLLCDIHNISDDPDYEYLKPYFKKAIIIYKCSCGEIKHKSSEHCRKCNNKMLRRTKWPTKDELSVLLNKSNYTQIGKKYGVSDNAVRKWAKIYELI